MSYSTNNLARVVAEGFFAVYVKPNPTDAEQQAAVANLVAILDSVYAHGMNRAQMDFTSKLINAIGSRSNMPAKELISLASSQ
jgi:hypothetical protein